MTEALQITTEYLFTKMNIHRIMANCMVKNKRSLAVLSRVGFVKEGVAKDYLMINGRWEDHILTSLTNKNFNSI